MKEKINICKNCGTETIQSEKLENGYKFRYCPECEEKKKKFKKKLRTNKIIFWLIFIAIMGLLGALIFYGGMF